MDKKIIAAGKQIHKIMEGLLKADKIRDRACEKGMAKKKSKKKGEKYV